MSTKNRDSNEERSFPPTRAEAPSVHTNTSDMQAARHLFVPDTHAPSEPRTLDFGDLVNLYGNNNVLAQLHWDVTGDLAPYGHRPSDEALKAYSDKSGKKQDARPSGWTDVDMKTDGPAVNQKLQDMPVDGYNCKYYLKTHIEGRKPKDKNPSDSEIPKGYMEEHGYHKTSLQNFQSLKDGDVVMIKAPEDGKIHISPTVHVAIVQRDAPGNIYLIQKTDDIHPVQRCSIQTFVNHYGVKIPGPLVDVYTH